MRYKRLIAIGAVVLALAGCTATVSSIGPTTTVRVTATTAATTSALGTPTNPVPFGKTASVDGWTVEVLSVTPEAQDSLLHTPAPAEYVLEVYTLQLTRTAVDPANPAGLMPRLLGTSGVKRSAGTTPNCYRATPSNTAVHQGGTIQESGCISMSTSDVDAVYFVLGVGEDSPRTWFAAS